MRTERHFLDLSRPLMTLTKNFYFGVRDRRLQCTEEGLGVEKWKRLNADYSFKKLDNLKKRRLF